jgi:hypothetical protein
VKACELEKRPRRHGDIVSVSVAEVSALVGPALVSASVLIEVLASVVASVVVV